MFTVDRGTFKTENLNASDLQKRNKIIHTARLINKLRVCIYRICEHEEFR